MPHIYAQGMLRQLYFGRLDMALHHEFDPVLGEDGVLALQHTIANDEGLSLKNLFILCDFYYSIGLKI